MHPEASNKLPGIEALPASFTILDAHAFLESVPSLIDQLRVRRPELAWSLNLSQRSLDLLTMLLSEGITPTAGDCIVNGINRSLIVEVSAYLGSTVVRNLNGKWHMPAEAGSEPYVTYHRGDHTKCVYPFSDVVEMAAQDEFDLAGWYRLLHE